MENGTLHLQLQPVAASPTPTPAANSKTQVGGWTAIAYILGNESFEKLASMSLIANLTVYLRTNYNLTGIRLVNVVTIWSGTSNLSSILGALLSDTYLGRFLTLLIGTTFSLLGMTAMTLTAAVPHLRPPPCPNNPQCPAPHRWQLAILFASLGLVAIGAGGIRPCNIAFGADQFDTTTEKGRTQLESFFNWWYFSFTLALVIALTAVVYIQTNLSWVAGFAIPMACLAISITIFLIGRRTYIHKTPRGTVFLDMAKVAVSAFKKRNIDLNSPDIIRLHNPPGDNPAEWETALKVEGFKFLDRAAAIVNTDEVINSSEWELCSLRQVACLKCFLGVIPVWISAVGCFLLMDQHSTFGVLQAIQMDRSVGKRFIIPPGWMGIASMIGLSLSILIYEQLYIPVSKKVLQRNTRLKIRSRIVIGIVISIICMVTAGFVERKRRSLALGKGSFISPLHVSMLLPQFLLSGLAESFSSVALMEFFTMRLPESMRSVAGAIFFLSLSGASYLSSSVVNVVRSATGGGKAAWVGGADLNENKLDNYYYVIAVFGVVNLVYFSCFAIKYVPL